MKHQTLLEIDDMQRFYVATYGAVMTQIGRASTAILFYDLTGNETDAESHTEIRRILDEVTVHLTVLPLSEATKQQVKYLYDSIGTEPPRVIAALMRTLHNSVTAEISPYFYLSLDATEKQLYEQNEPLFGKEVCDKFPSAAFDIAEAGRCLALERSTACVFHLMRVVEIAIKVVSAFLEVDEPKSPNWGSWLSALRENIKGRGAAWEGKIYFQDLHSRFDAIKDAQRNMTMHAGSFYTQCDARDIFNQTRNLMNKIASRMDQYANPRD